MISGKQTLKQLEEYAKQAAEIHRQTEQLVEIHRQTGQLLDNIKHREEIQQMSEQLLGYKQHDNKQEEFLTFDNMKGVL